MDIFAKSCPNIEKLQLASWRTQDDGIPDVLSGVYLPRISFKKLTSLSISGKFKLHDGAFLLSVN